MRFDQRATEEAESEASRGVNPILKEQAVRWRFGLPMAHCCDMALSTG